MKKFLRSLLCMLLALSMVLCFAACDSDDSKKDSDDDDEESTSAEAVLKAVYAEDNAKKFSFSKEKAIFNGFGGDDVDQIYDILKESNIEDSREAAKENMVESYSRSYGDDYKISYDLDSTDEMDKEMRTQFRDWLNECGENLNKTAKNLDEEDLADALDISESDAKKLLKAIKSFADTMEEAKVEEGVYLNYDRIIKGSEVDEDDERTMQTFAAYKVDGCWISVHSINLVEAYISLLEDI